MQVMQKKVVLITGGSTGIGAVIDVGGHLPAFRRNNHARIGTVELAINKAFSARIFSNSTEVLAGLAQPGSELYGIQNSHNGRAIIFGGGLPLSYDGHIVGAIDISGRSVDLDVEIALAASDAP